jgi:cytochrome oxidase Cu insertion factor (SCO1/SenC/PrrC family)
MGVKRGVTLGAVLILVVAVGIALGVGTMQSPPELGPADGHDLPPTDLERVTAGAAAPDFTLQALSGDVLTLSDFRGERNVVLVFYRGHW